MFERSLEDPRPETEPRAPLQAGDEEGNIDQHSGGDGSNDPTPDEKQQPPPP